MYFSRIFFWLYFESKEYKRNLITADNMKIMAIDVWTGSSVVSMTKETLKFGSVFNSVTW